MKFIKNKIKYLVAALVVIIVSFVGVAYSNADYICTVVVNENDPCSGGSWGDWQLVSSQTNSQTCLDTQAYQRVYTGTRTIKHTLTYLNLRTTCQKGYTQARIGTSSGQSGFHGGNVQTESSVCQLVETKTETASRSINGGTCGAIISPTQTNVSQTQKDISTSASTTSVYSTQQIEDIRRSLLKASITVTPNLVNKDQTVNVVWSSVAADSCEVTSDGGDKYTGLTGNTTSLPIKAKTKFTVTCKNTYGDVKTDMALVNLAPNYTEQ